MSLYGLKIGFCICGSFCTFDDVIPEIKRLVSEGANITPIFSESAYNWDTRFYSAKEFRSIIEGITGNKVVNSVVGAEPIGHDLFICKPGFEFLTHFV